MATEEHASDPATHAREYAGSEANTYYMVVTGSDHMGLSDAGLFDARFSRETPSNNAAYERALLTSELTRSLVEEFFGKYLKHSSAPELDVLFHVNKE